MKKTFIGIIALFLLLGCETAEIKKNNLSKSKQIKKMEVFECEVENLTADNTEPKKIVLKWKLKNKSNVDKIEVYRDYINGTGFSKITEASIKFDEIMIEQDVAAYALYKVRLVAKDGGKSRGKIVKTIANTPNNAEFNVMNKYREKPLIKYYEVTTYEGIEYIPVDAIYDIINLFYGEVEFIVTSNSAVIFKSDNSFRVEIDLNKNIVERYDKEGATYKNWMKESRDYYNEESLKSGVLTKRDIVKNNLERIDEVFFKTQDTHSYKLSDFGVKIIKQNGKLYLPLGLFSLVVSDGLISISGDSGKYIVSNFGYYSSGSFSRGEMSPQLKEFTIRYFINLCKNYYTVSKDKKIDFDDILNQNKNNLFAAKNNSKFYEEFNNLITNFNDWHTRFEMYGKSIYDIKGFNMSSERERAYEEIREITKKMPIEKFDKTIIKEIDENIGYVYFPNWVEISSDIDKTFKKFKDKKVIIVDERWNGGGELTIGLQFIKYVAGDSIRIDLAKGNEILHQTIINDRKIEDRYKGKIVILTNKLSYSCSTFVPAIMRSNEIGTIIGEKTGGGGSPTVGYVLPDNSFVRISSGILITDKEGNSYDNGINPDIIVSENYENNKDAVLDYTLKYVKEILN